MRECAAGGGGANCRGEGREGGKREVKMAF